MKKIILLLLIQLILTSCNARINVSGIDANSVLTHNMMEPFMKSLSLYEKYGFMPPENADSSFDGINRKTISYRKGELLVSIFYPETESGSINSEIYGLVTESLEGFKTRNSNKGILAVRYSCIKYNDFILSIIFDNYSYTKDLGFSVSKKTFVYDLMGGIQIPQEEIFKGNGYLDIIRKYTYDVLSESKDIFYQLPEDIVMLMEKDEFEQYIFDDSYLYVYPNFDFKHALEVKIPLAEFGGDFLAESYISRYFGEKDVVEDEIASNNQNNEHTTKKDKHIALTFDDGPERKYTPMILDALKEHDAKATFFVLGHRVEAMPDIVTRFVEEGHAVGSHTYNHLQLSVSADWQIREQVDLTNDLLRNITGMETNMIRPPYGARNDRVVDIVKNRNMSVIIWSIDPQDWKVLDADTVAWHVIENVKDGDIILLHDIYETSYEAAVTILETLSEQGYNFVTVPELIKIKAGEMIPGGIYRNGYGTVPK